MSQLDDRVPDVTEWLVAWSDGRQDALDHLLPLVYENLRQLAGAYMRREPAGHALQPTALVHEAYLRLIDQNRAQWRNRAQFFGVAAQLMRRILIDHARAQQADKRGGGWERTTLAGDVAASTGTRQFDVLALHEALERLAEFDPRQARIVELRYFGGLTVDETAEVMNLSTATVEREWTIAKAWLRVNLAPQAG